jgi:hypothetical protein
MIYPLVRELAGCEPSGGIPVTVTCRVLTMARLRITGGWSTL